MDNVHYLPDSLDFSWEKLACETIVILLGCTCSESFYSEYSESTWHLVGVAKTDQLGSNGIKTPGED